MKTVKNIISASDVTANLNIYFPGRNGICTEVFNDGLRSFILIEFKDHNIELLIQDKRVFINERLKPTRAANYYQECKDFSLPVVKKQIGKESYIPFLWNKKTADKPAIEEEKNILICCNQARPKSEVLKPEQFIRKHAGKKYADIFKVIADRSKTENMKAIFEVAPYPFEQWRKPAVFLQVEHKTGFYRFPLTNLCDTCEDSDIIRLFIDLFLPENVINNPLIKFEVKPELSKTLVISATGKLKMKNLCNRLKRNYSTAA